MARQVSIGVGLYLFVADDGVPAPHLIVSAHGGYYPLPKVGSTLGPGWLRVPTGMELFFYVQNGASLEDPRVDGLFSNTPTEIKRSGEVARNYMLAKFQGRHSDEAETYASLKHAVDANRTSANLQEDMLRSLGIDLSVPMEPDERVRTYEARLTELPQDEVRKLRLAWGARRMERYDVLTVRNRTVDVRSAVIGGVTLKEAIAALPPEHRYEKIHCNFCRTNMIRSKGTFPAVAGSTWERGSDGFRR